VDDTRIVVPEKIMYEGFNSIDVWNTVVNRKPIHVLVNRHPIHDSRLNAVGYEAQAHTSIIGYIPDNNDSSVSTAGILKLISQNLQKLTGNVWSMVTLPWEAIVTQEYAVLPKERVVIAVEDGPSNDSLVGPVEELAASGYRFAAPLSNENLAAVRGFADILTLNATDVQRVEAVRRHSARLLVSGVETHEEFQRWKNLGADLFEGYFYCTPKQSGSAVLSNSLAAVRLIAALQNPDVRVGELEDIIAYDVALSYKLLRFVNSVSLALPRQVTSIRHAVGMVGIERIRKWASLLLMSKIGKPSELLVTAALRARMCEHLADSQKEPRQSTFFTVGLLSVLDALLDRPMSEAVEDLPLSQEIRDALVDRKGPLGTTLRAVIAYEQNDWKRHALLRFRPTDLQRSYMSSLDWTHDFVGRAS